MPKKITALAPKRDPRVAEYIAACHPFARPILNHLRKVVHSACPQARETLKWGMPTFMYQDKILCGVAGFKAHCAFWFWEGSGLMEAKDNKAGQAMGNFGRITSLKDLPSVAVLKKYVRKAMKIRDAEVKTQVSKKKKR